MLARFQRALGAKRGVEAYQDLRQRNDPGTSHTINGRSFDYQTRSR